MTNKELENELEETKQALAETQEALLTLGELVGKLRAVLKVHGAIDDLDISYIKGEITDEEYVTKYKEQYSLTNAFLSVLGTIPTTDNKEKE